MAIKIHAHGLVMFGSLVESLGPGLTSIRPLTVEPDDLEGIGFLGCQVGDINVEALLSLLPETSLWPRMERFERALQKVISRHQSAIRCERIVAAAQMKLTARRQEFDIQFSFIHWVNQL